MVGPFEEDNSLELLFSLLSTLSSIHLTRLTIHFVAIPGSYWPKWKAIDIYLHQMVQRCHLQPAPRVALRKRSANIINTTYGEQLLPKYWRIGPVEVADQHAI